MFTVAAFYGILSRQVPNVGTLWDFKQRRRCIINRNDYEPDELARDQEPEAPKKKKKKHRARRALAIILSIVLFLESAYCFVVFTDISAIKELREMYIETALSTLSHRWLADWFLPSYMVDQVQYKMDLAKQSQKDYISDNSDRYAETTEPSETTDDVTESTAPTAVPENAEQEAFYELFWELSRTSFEEYLDEHPETLDNGWSGIYINEAGLDDAGTTIYTTMGEQVLAIDVPNQILIVRVQGTGYLGALAIAKDPSQLRCHASDGLVGFRYGRPLEDLVIDGGGLLGMNASGFIDPDGNGTGGLLSGYAVCEDEHYGSHSVEDGDKRIELSENNKFYIVDAQTPISEGTTDAVEFSPALVVDGELTIGGFAAWNAINPRACIGQSDKGEILMLVIEGRQITRSIGTDVETCANILMRHRAYAAMNLDGGTTAVMWYDGEYITKCSNTKISSRLLPNAWVYGYSD